MRAAAYTALGPFDFLARAINGKGDLPPLRLRRHVGPLRSFEASGAEFQAYLRVLAKLERHESVLDIGCGCGLMALQLKDFLGHNARYAGVDIHQSSINWCKRNIQSRHGNFEFLPLERHQFTSAAPETSPETFRLPFPDRGFDLILLKSVFTHLLPRETDAHLGEVARLLSDRGRCLATFFLLNEKQDELKKRGLNQIAFEFGDEAARYAYRHSPESAVALNEGLVMEFLAKHHLELKQPIIYGSWSGRPEGLSFQDMLLIRRRES
jgi:ubiquinone/menaquinone biosynthesis C-methylase UbiE